MSKLQLSVAIGDCDRTRALLDGRDEAVDFALIDDPTVVAKDCHRRTGVLPIPARFESYST